MLDDYFAGTLEKKNRLEVVKAALEIAKASVAASSEVEGDKSGQDLENVAAKIKLLADAIETALVVNKK